MNELFLEQKYSNPKILGKFIGEESYDTIINSDCNVYKPNGKLGIDDRDESNVLIKFRKGVFSDLLCSDAFVALLEAATPSQNRGVAAGPRRDKLNNREWLTMRQDEILRFFETPPPNNLGGDRYAALHDIEEKYSGDNFNTPDKRGHVWLKNKIDETGFEFEGWLNATITLFDLDENAATQSAIDVRKTMISITTYANPVNSGIAGYFDRYPRIPYCRATSYTNNDKSEFADAIPFINKISEQFSELMPGRYAYQKDQCDNIDPSFTVGDSVYTTITVNKNFRTACHRDAGDLEHGFGSMVALSDGVHYDGGLLIFPEYRVAVDIRPGDMFLFDPHEIHGNTDITSENNDHARVTLVLYFREKMLQCEIKVIEDLRHQFVELRRKDTDHPLWKAGWNGVSEGMFFSEDWIDFLLKNGMNDYVHENFELKKQTSNNLEGFF